MKHKYKAIAANIALISIGLLLLTAGIEATTLLVVSLIKPWGAALPKAMIHWILRGLIASTFLAAITALVIARHPK
jgi:hypothetical protein